MFPIKKGEKEFSWIRTKDKYRAGVLRCPVLLRQDPQHPLPHKQQFVSESASCDQWYTVSSSWFINLAANAALIMG